MSGFKALKDISTTFEADLQQLTGVLHAAKVGDNAESVIAKKLHDLAILSSKYRLLHAKETASTPQVMQRVQNEVNVMAEYEEAVQRQIAEGAFVKAISRNQAVKSLLITPDDKLNQELVIRKKKIKQQLNRLVSLDTELVYLDGLMMDRRDELEALRIKWDSVLSHLREKRSTSVPEVVTVEPGSLHEKLSTLVDKMELMRRLLGPLATGRSTRYDWLADPHNRLAVLPLTRVQNTVNGFLQGIN